ncbi:MFS transporter [Nonomuraea sp. NPDC005650]|uniref:MFS transporter n=1 Tax=Nonomuraea sp. NPDC005650 TaxID=3157045 RepID=UPI0033A1D6F7
MSGRPSAVAAMCFIGARACSVLGSMASALVVLVWVREMTGKDSAAALSMLVFALPTLAYPLIGQLVDRVDRLVVLIASQVLGAGLISCLAFVHDASDVWLVYAVQLGQGINLGLISIAGDALLPQAAPRDRLPALNGWLQSALSAVRIVSPGLGVMVFTAWGGIGSVILLDVATYAAGIVLLLPLVWLRRRSAEERPQRESYLATVRSGARLITGNGDVRVIALSAVGCIMIAGLISSIWYAVITSGLGMSADFAGALATAQAAGGVLGGPVGSRLARAGRTRLAALLALAAFAATGLMLLSGSPVLATAGIGLAGVGATMLMVVYATVIQTSVPENVLGRAFAAVDAIINMAQVTGLAIGTLWLASAGTFEPVLLGSVVLVVPIAVAVWRGYDAGERRLPEAAQPIARRKV